MCTYQAKQQFVWARDCINFEKCLQKLLIAAARSMEATKLLYETIKEHPGLAKFDEFKDLEIPFEKCEKTGEELTQLVSLLLDTQTFKHGVSLFSNKGVITRAYILMCDFKEQLEDTLAAVGRVDAYYSLAKLCKEFEYKPVKFAFANYANAPTPFIKAKNFWHPLIDTDKVVPNTLTLGTDNKRPNAIITGPNEGGKSTILKALATCLIMAQTIGIVPAQTFTFTPFHSIATYLNITDDIGAGNSLFKSEVLRTDTLITKIKNLKENEFSFAVFDEVFNGTSPLEGEAAAYSVAHHLSNFPKSINLIATHFPLLTKLETVTNQFANYKVSVIQNKISETGDIDKSSDTKDVNKNTQKNTIIYPYKLEPGISNQHIAIDILRYQGFDNSILEEAETIVAQACSG